MADPPSSPSGVDRPSTPDGATSPDALGAQALGIPIPQNPSKASVPPSEPRSSRASFDALDSQVDRPARLQMIVALVLGLVLVAIPLYLWRRPRAESIAAQTGTSDAGAATVIGGSASVEEKIVLGEAKTVSCHDPGPKKTPPEQCDRVSELEKAFAKAIEESSSCVAKDAGGGTIIYIADVTFKRKAVSVATPKEGRTLKSAKVATACEKLVRNKLASVSFDAVKHEHARYRVSITATYPGVVKP